MTWSVLRGGMEMHKKPGGTKGNEMSSLKFVLSVFSSISKPKPLCHLLLDMPPSQRILNLSVVAVICLWFGAEAQEEEPISHVRRKQCLCKATRHQPPVPTEAALQNAKCQGWGGCTVALTVCGGGNKVSPVVISTFPSPSQPSLKWVLLICCALSGQGVGKLQ